MTRKLTVPSLHRSKQYSEQKNKIQIILGHNYIYVHAGIVVIHIVGYHSILEFHQHWLYR